VKPFAAAGAYASGPKQSYWQQQMDMLIGPNEAIGGSRCICQWAQMKSSATAGAYANGPKRSHWQQQMHMMMGTNEAISSSRHICQWAHMKASAAAAVYTYANGVGIGCG
jgi:hypothetical protein